MGFGDIFRIKEFKNEIARLQQEHETLVSEKQALQSTTAEMRNQLNELGAFDYYKVKEMTEQLQADYEAKRLDLQKKYEEKQQAAEADLQKQLSDLERSISDRENKSQEILDRLNELRLQEAKVSKNLKTQTNKLSKSEPYRKS